MVILAVGNCRFKDGYPGLQLHITISEDPTLQHMTMVEPIKIVLLIVKPQLI